MPLPVPTVDRRNFQELFAEALARIPVHTREWTNYNSSDPGITLIELWAFLTENSLYISQQIPERNRLKFLSMLGISLSAGSAAQGIVTLRNSRGPQRTVTINDGLEVRAGDVPFRTTMGLDVLPVETAYFYKQELKNPPEAVKAYYRQLYSSYTGASPTAADNLTLYETRRFEPKLGKGINLTEEAVDGSLWVALLLRSGDSPTPENVATLKAQARDELANRTLSVGFVPYFEEPLEARLSPQPEAVTGGGVMLRFSMPQGPQLPASRTPAYQPLEANAEINVLTEPGVVEVQLPGEEVLTFWEDLEPLEPGAAGFPPDLEDTALNNRLITWLRIQAVPGVEARLLWVGINATPILQRSHVSGEILPDGTGEPDQVIYLARRPVVAESLRLRITSNNTTTEWIQTDDLLTASPEVQSVDPRYPPGTPPFKGVTPYSYRLDGESGKITFGDGTRGMRPPPDAMIRADYDYSRGLAGNVGRGAVNSSPALPMGIEVTNEIPTWGGADPQTLRDGERQVTRYLQHRDRPVTVGDFEIVVRGTSGVEVGRVEVIAAASPYLGGVAGRAPGAVTLVVIPKHDPVHPYAPEPSQTFLDAICRHLEPRRLITTEIFLRGPEYRDFWVSIGISVVPGISFAQVREAVKQAVQNYLSPLPLSESDLLDGSTPVYSPPSTPAKANGWPLNKDVHRLELAAAASRVSGVLQVNDLYLFYPTQPTDTVPINGLQLPRLAGLSVTLGQPLTADQIPGLGIQTDMSLIEAETQGGFITVPVLPEECD